MHSIALFVSNIHDLRSWGPNWYPFLNIDQVADMESSDWLMRLSAHCRNWNRVSRFNIVAPNICKQSLSHRRVWIWSTAYVEHRWVVHGEEIIRCYVFASLHVHQFQVKHIKLQNEFKIISRSRLEAWRIFHSKCTYASFNVFVICEMSLSHYFLHFSDLRREPNLIDFCQNTFFYKRIYFASNILTYHISNFSERYKHVRELKP